MKQTLTPLAHNPPTGFWPHRRMAPAVTQYHHELAHEKGTNGSAADREVKTRTVKRSSGQPSLARADGLYGRVAHLGL